MGILSSIVTGTAQTRTTTHPPRMGATHQFSTDPLSGFMYNAIGQQSATGEFITPDIAMHVGVVSACVRVLAESVATTSLHAFERLPDGSKKRLPDDDPLEILIAQQPNATQSAYEYWETKMAYASLRGLGISEIVPGVRGAASELKPIHPDRVTPVRDPDGTTNFRILPIKDEPFRTLLQDEVFFLRDMSPDSVTGFPRVAFSRDTIGLARAAERFGGSFFSNSAQPSGQLTTPNRISELTAQQLSDSWKRAHGANKQQGTAVLWDGMKFEPISFTNKQSQFLESRKFSVVEICRIFRVPPHLVQDLDRAILNNITGLTIQFVTYTLMKWFRLIEAAIQRDLIINRPNVFAEFQVQSLMRGDPATRAAYYESGLRNQWLVPNEVRKFENLDPLEGGDETVLQPTEPGPRESTAPVPEPDQDAAIISQDIAQRLAKVEHSRLQTRAAKAADDPDRFLTWGTKELDRLRDHTIAALAPFVLMRVPFGGYDPNAVAASIVADGVVNLTAYTNGGVPDSGARAAAINERILEGIVTNDN